MTTAPFEPGSDPSIVPEGDPDAPDVLTPGEQPDTEPSPEPTES